MPGKLVAGRWSLVAGRWSLVAGRWSLVAGRWSLVALQTAFVAYTGRYNFSVLSELLLSLCVHYRGLQPELTSVMSRFIALLIAVSGAAFVAPGAISHIASRFPETPSPASNQCVIKGNISINSGERIYHVPGQKFYTPTKISPQYGERWFCSEGEARAAGWRKAER